MIRILLADDHPVVRDGLRGMLAGEADFEVVGEAASGVEAVRLAEREQPDVVLMDLQMPEMDGATATAEIAARFPATRVLVLTTYDTDADILRAVEAGATGYLLKDTPRERLFRPSGPPPAGETVLAPTVADPAGQPDARRRPRRPSRPGRSRCSPLVARGLTNADIGRRAVHQRGHGQDPPAARVRQARRRRPHRRGVVAASSAASSPSPAAAEAI